MRIPRSPSWFAFLVVATIVAFPRVTAAQDAPYPPLRCFQDATAAGLQPVDAEQLCTGARSVAPAHCFQQAIAQLSVPTTEAARLCAAATSDAPVACARRLVAANPSGSYDIVQACGPAWGAWLAPRGTSTSPLPACVDEALARTSLPRVDAETLCTGARSSAPAACVSWGQSNTLLMADQLIRLCSDLAWTRTGRPPNQPWLR